MDITKNFHGGNPESDEAFAKSLNTAERDRKRILSLAKNRGVFGIISDEAERILDLRHQTCSARISELKRDGLLWPIDLCRDTRTGCKARVLVERSICEMSNIARYDPPKKRKDANA